VGASVSEVGALGRRMWLQGQGTEGLLRGMKEGEAEAKLEVQTQVQILRWRRWEEL
jgi:hypothetical protein